MTITTGSTAVAGIGADRAADLVAVHARHHDVEQHEVGLLACDLGERLGAGGGGDDR